MAPRGPNDEEGVVDPDDLDITKNEEVHELRDGQYVIATGDEADDFDLDEVRAETPEASDTPEFDPRAALVEHLGSISVANGFVVAGRFDGEIDVHECASNDLGVVFGELMTWYATNVDDDTPPAEVLGILCVAAGLRVRYPIRTVVDLLAAHDLSPEDSIGDLLEAVRADGLVLPPEDRS